MWGCASFSFVIARTWEMKAFGRSTARAVSMVRRAANSCASGSEILCILTKPSPDDACLVSGFAPLTPAAGLFAVEELYARSGFRSIPETLCSSENGATELHPDLHGYTVIKNTR